MINDPFGPTIVDGTKDGFGDVSIPQISSDVSAHPRNAPSLVDILAHVVGSQDPAQQQEGVCVQETCSQGH